MTIDTKVNFKGHLEFTCKKTASTSVSLTRRVQMDILINKVRCLYDNRRINLPAKDRDDKRAVRRKSAKKKQ